jgi:hypothetical protein
MQQFLRNQQVAGRGNGDKLGNAFNDAEDKWDEQAVHGSEACRKKRFSTTLFIVAAEPLLVPRE